MIGKFCLFLLFIILSLHFIDSAKPSNKPKQNKAAVDGDDFDLSVFNEKFVEKMEK